jgi:exosome complex exonuclease RRP6
MQISTRTEDFVVDTLKLRIHIGPHLRELFKDPSKRKVSASKLLFLLMQHIFLILLTVFMFKQVMHGADKDIVWLQRDFGIYVCNLFDTGQVCL